VGSEEIWLLMDSYGHVGPGCGYCLSACKIKGVKLSKPTSVWVNNSSISGLICRMSPIPLRLCWRGGMNSIEMDNSKLIAFLGHEPQTPLTEAVRSTLAGLGCI
ncbi:TPA: hypothetical protein ACX9W5_003294, partial [Enterobacter asburiae]